MGPKVGRRGMSKHSCNLSACAGVSTTNSKIRNAAPVLAVPAVDAATSLEPSRACNELLCEVTSPVSAACFHCDAAAIS